MDQRSRLVLIVSEKTHAANTIAAAWRIVHPNDRLMHHMAYPIGMFGVQHEPDLPWEALPVIRPVAHTRKGHASHQQPNRADVVEDFADAANAADLLVCATDPDPQGARHFCELLDAHPNHHQPNAIPWIRLNTMNLQDIVDSIRAAHTIADPTFQEMLLVGQARQYFHHNYTANAHHLFDRCLAHIGAPPTQHLVSKNALQLILHFASTPDLVMTWGGVLSAMQNGSLHNGPKTAPMGSPTSRADIVDNLVKAGLLEDSKPNTNAGMLRIAPLGQAFAALIHPDLHDPSQSQRIRQWEKSWPASKPDMDTYLTHFLTTQKTHMEHLRIAPTTTVLEGNAP